jgi:hypothetical protein
VTASKLADDNDLGRMKNCTVCGSASKHEKLKCIPDYSYYRECTLKAARHPTQSKAFGIARDYSLERLDNQD